MSESDVISIVSNDGFDFFSYKGKLKGEGPTPHFLSKYKKAKTFSKHHLLLSCLPREIVHAPPLMVTGSITFSRFSRLFPATL